MPRYELSESLNRPLSTQFPQIKTPSAIICNTFTKIKATILCFFVHCPLCWVVLTPRKLWIGLQLKNSKTLFFPFNEIINSSNYISNKHLSININHIVHYDMKLCNCIYLLALSQCNLMHAYSEVCGSVFSEAYSQIDMNRIVASHYIFLYHLKSRQNYHDFIQAKVTIEPTRDLKCYFIYRWGSSNTALLIQKILFFLCNNPGTEAINIWQHPLDWSTS